MTVTVSTDNYFSRAVAEYIQKRAETNLRSVKPWSGSAVGFQENFTWPEGSDTIQFPFVSDITYAASSAHLVEGTMPTPAAIAVNAESMTPVQLGYVVGGSDLSLFEFPALMLEFSDRIAENAALNLDNYARSVLVSGSSAIYAGTVSTRASLTAGITSAKVREAAARLRKANVPTFADGTYHCLATQEQIITLQSETAKGAWTDASLYSGAKQILNGEAGTLWGVRFINTGSQEYIVSGGGSASADVHVALILGPNFAARTDLQRLRSYWAAPGGRTDLLEQSFLVGWKWAGGVKVLSLRGEAGLRLESVETTLT